MEKKRKIAQLGVALVAAVLLGCLAVLFVQEKPAQAQPTQATPTASSNL